MKRLALLLLIALIACRSPEEDAATREAVWATTVTHWATQTAPTPSPLPLTATVKAYIDNQWATVLAPTPTQGPPDPTREAIAATTAAYRFAEQTAVIQSRQFFADYEATRTAPSPTPLPPTATAIPPTATPTRQPWERPVLDLNTANEQDMANLPANVQGDRLGLARAQRIGIFRQTFTIIELNDLLQIVGFGEATVAAIRLCDCTSQR